MAQTIDLANLTDEQLALGAQRGQTRYLATLVERHHGPLLGFLYRLTGGDRPLAEDLLQETFLRLAQRLSQYRYPRPLKPWLYAIAVNLARDHFKRADTRYTDTLPDDESAVADPPAPEEAAIADEDARQVAAALTALPVHQREAILLRYYHDWTLAEIAAALDIPLGTVKSRLSLGLKRLKEMLADS